MCGDPPLVAEGILHAGHAIAVRLIRRLADEGMTVLLSSHLLGEVEEVCNRVAIVRSGTIVYEGTIAALARGATVTIFAEFIKLAATYGKLASLIDRITR